MCRISLAVREFTVGPLTGRDTSLPVNELTLPALASLPAAIRTRQLSLNEAVSDVLRDVGPREAQLGLMDDRGFPMPMWWMDPITENPRVGDTEVWEIFNFTADAHPIHLHQVMFEVVNRQALATDAEGMALTPAQLTGDPISPDPWD